MKNIRYVFLILSILLTGLNAQGHSRAVFDLIGTGQENGFYTSKTSSINIQITVDESGGNVGSIQLRGIALSGSPTAYDESNFPEETTRLYISYSAQYSNSGGSGYAYNGIFNTGEVHTITVSSNEIEGLQNFATGKKLYFALFYSQSTFDGDDYEGDDIRGDNTSYYYFDIDTQGPTLSAIKEDVSDEFYNSWMYISTPHFKYTVGSEAIFTGEMTWTRTAGSGTPVLTNSDYFPVHGVANTTNTYDENPGLTSGDVYTIELSVTDTRNNSNTYTYSNVTYDTEVPTVESVYSVDGNYTETDELIIYVQFSEPVLKSGTPTLSLEVPDNSGYTVEYITGYNTDTFQFRYIVQDGHSSDDLQYEDDAALTAGDGIMDRAGNDAILTLPGLATANSLAGNNDISIDALDPGTFTVQNVTATGGTGVANYWNGTNTGVNVTIPIANDNSLDGGTVQLQARTADIETFQNLGPLTTIANEDVNTSKVVTASASGTGDTDIDELTNYNDGDQLEFQAVITDNAGNSRTGTSSVTKLTVDTESPTVTTVTSNDVETTYAIGDTIDIIVNFNSAVDVVTTNGTPQLTLETGNSDAVVNYSSGTGTSVLVFTYTVSTNEESDDLDYASTGALSSNGGTLRDAAGNDAVLTLPVTGSGSSLAGEKNYIVDGVPPASFMVGAASVNGTVERTGYWNSTSTSIDVIIPIASDNSLKTGTAQLKGKISSNDVFTSFGSPVTITAGHLTAGSLTISAIASQFDDIQDFGDGETVTITAVLTDSAGNATTGTASATTIIVDQALPADFIVGSVLTTGTPIVAGYWNSHNTGVNVTVPIANDPTLNGGTVFIKANAGSGFETVSDTIAVNAINTNKLVNLSRTQIEGITGYAEDGIISFRALLTDVAGNPKESSTSGTTLAIDETAPEVSGVTSSDEDSNPFKVGDLIDLDVVFDDAVDVITTGGTPQLTINTGAVVNYTSGDGSTTLTFQYEVGEGEESDDLDYTSTAALTLTGATIRDGAGNNADLTLPTVGGAGSLGFNKAIVIDGVLPSDFTVGSVITSGGVIVAGYWNASNTAIKVRVPLESSDNSLTDGRLRLRAEAEGTYEDLGPLTTIVSDSVAGGFQTITVADSGTADTDFEELFGFNDNDEITLRAIITDEAGNATTGTASATTIIVDQNVPTAQVVGDVTTTGGRAVDNYWNSTNDGVDIIIPLEISDLSLTDGSIRMEARVGNNPLWTNIGDSFSITDLDRLNGTKTVSVDSGGTVSTDVRELPGFANGLSLQFRATVTDVAGNSADWTVSDSTLLIDEAAPLVTSVSSTLADGYYTIGQVIPITVLFNESILVSTIAGTPYIEIQTGSSYPVYYTSGDGTDLLTFNYTVLAGHNNNTLDYVANNSLILNGGTMIDVAGNNAILTLDDPQGIGSLAAGKNITVDTQVPAAFISIFPDSLVRADESPQIIADFSEQMDSAYMYILYNGGAVLDTVSMGNQDTLTWVYTIQAIPDSNDGRATISITGFDRAGNAMLDANTTGRNLLRLDNTDPVLTDFNISSGAYINHQQFGWYLEENLGRLESGTIDWVRTDGPGGDTTTTLTGDELRSGTKLVSDLNDSPALVDGTTYDIIFTAIDSAGNAGRDTILSVTFDTTAPTCSLSYSHYQTASDTVVTITALFLEKIPGDPPIEISTANGAGPTFNGTMTSDENDSLHFSYLWTTPGGMSFEGIALITLTATDLASNVLSTDNTFFRDTLIVDNSPALAAFNYENRTQPSLYNLGQGGDSLWITIDFDDQMRASLEEAPTLDIRYAESAGDSIIGLPYALRTNGDSTWVFKIRLLTGENNSGRLEVIVNAQDLAGNPAIEGWLRDMAFRVDNTLPELSITNVDSGEYINHRQFGWTLTEELRSGSVTWDNVSGTAGDTTTALTNLELTELIKAESELNEPPLLIDGTTYDITFSVVDLAGNTGLTTLSQVTFDTTAPSCRLAYSHYYAAADTEVTITATFLELVPTNPEITITYNNGAGITDAGTMTPVFGADSIEFTYQATIPGDAINEGIALITLDATDLATNALSTGSTFFRDTLIVDSSPVTATFEYVNQTQPYLSNLGLVGDTIRITARFNDQMRINTEAPVLNIQYADSTDDSIEGWTYLTKTNSDSTWIYEITLPDSSKNDGFMTILATGLDLAGNSVTTFISAAVFEVDNTPPDAFTTGSVATVAGNNILGWINNTNDSLRVAVPIVTDDINRKLYLAYAIPAKMDTSQTWSVAGPSYDMTVSGTRNFFSNIDTVVAALNEGMSSSVEQGDTILIRAIKYDQVGNNTAGLVSAQKLIYDIAPPTVGTEIIWNDTSPDTLVSEDSLHISWGEFTDPEPNPENPALGIGYYEWRVYQSGPGGGSNIVDWTSSGLSITKDTVLALIHDRDYSFEVRAWDVAGNESATILNSSSFRRVNSAPVITVIDSTVVYEDVEYADTVIVSDIDLNTLNGDSFTFQLVSTHRDGWSPDTLAAIDTAGIITWTPAPQDTGIYDFTVYVDDNWGFRDSIEYVISALPVNDAPKADFRDTSLVLVEDSLRTVHIYLNSFVTDEDNLITEMDWYRVVILDTVNNPAYPEIGYNYPPDNATDDQIAMLKINSGQVITDSSDYETLAAQWAANPPLTVDIVTANDSTIATITADTNYFGKMHRIIFYVRDPDNATSLDTILLEVQSRNDQPVLLVIADQAINENDSLLIDLGQFAYDVDDSSLTFTVLALTNPDSITISQSQYVSSGLGDSILFTPKLLWSDSALIQVIITDDSDAADTVQFVLDIIRVMRPHLSIAIIQNGVFTNFFEVIVTDTMEKTVYCAVTIDGDTLKLDTLAAYTYTGRTIFEQALTFTIVANAQGVVGDTSITRDGSIVLARSGGHWNGSSPDGLFQVTGEIGTVPLDQPVLVIDSTLFEYQRTGQAAYRLGAIGMNFEKPVLLSFTSASDELALYYSADGVFWQELPTMTVTDRLLAWTAKMGYFKTGPRTLFVPEATALRPNYPNPFNPATIIEYDLGFLDGPQQKVNIVVFDLLGRQVVELFDGHQTIGRHAIRWDSRNARGVPSASGVYFVRMMAGNQFVKTQKIMLLR